MELAIEKGRYGYGNVFVFASGNGGINDDNCNYDGYANSIYTITIGTHPLVVIVVVIFVVIVVVIVVSPNTYCLSSTRCSGREERNAVLR